MADADSNLRLPRVTIQFCTQCKWNLRAAYFAQELLQTFSTSLGEVALQPSTGGVFKVDIYHFSLHPNPSSTRHTPLWDRHVDGGFPETKELKRRVRDVIEPGRDLGHVDKDYGRGGQQQPAAATAAEVTPSEFVASTKGHQDSAPVPGPTLPRPRDIAARADTLIHPPDAPQPAQREWGSRDSDRRIPGGGVGGTKPTTAPVTGNPEPGLKPRPDRSERAQKDEQMEMQDGGTELCEDCG